MNEPNPYEAPRDLASLSATSPTGAIPEAELTGKRTHPSLSKALVYFAATTSAFVLLMANRLSQADPEGQGFIIGTIGSITLIPAIVVGALSRRPERGYGWLRFGVYYFLGVAILIGTLIRGRTR